MGQYSLIIVGGFIVIGGLIAVGSRTDNRVASGELAENFFKEEARDAAHAGLNLTLRKIVSDRGEWTNEAKYEIAETEFRRASYQTDVIVHGLGDTLDIVATGWETRARSYRRTRYHNACHRRPNHPYPVRRRRYPAWI